MAAAKKGPDLAIVFGPAKGGSKKPPAAGDDMMMGEESEEASEPEVSPEFQAAAVEAFPELAESPERMAAFKRAVQACYESEEE